MPDNNCKLALTEPFLIKHWCLNSLSLTLGAKPGAKVVDDSKIPSQRLLLGRKAAGAESGGGLGHWRPWGLKAWL